jgi:hypothetical protein
VSKPVAKAITCHQFIRDVLGISLTPGQSALVKVTVDRVNPMDLDDPLERDAAEVMFGTDVDVVPPEARRVVTVVAGRGSGKTAITAYVALYRALTADLSMLAKGEPGVGIVVAPIRALARQIMSFIRGAIDENPKLRAMVTRTTQHEIEMRRPDAHDVALRIVPADKGGAATRGVSIFHAALEECAFFESEGAVKDSEIKKAIAPRLLPGAQLWLISSPWKKSGLLWTTFDRNWNTPRDSIVCHAASTMLLGIKRTITAVKAEWLADAENAAVELGSIDGREGPRFLDDATSQYFGTDLIAQAIVEELPPAPVYVRKVAAADHAFRADGSAVCVVGEREDGTIDVLDMLELKPNRRKALLPSAVVADFASILKKHGVFEIWADSHSREMLRESYKKHGVTLRDAPNSNRSNTEAHATTRGAFLEGRIKISARELTLIRQLKEVTSIPLAGGLIKFSKPRRANEHGDVASSFILAASQALGRKMLSDAQCRVIGVGARKFGLMSARDELDDHNFELPDGSIDWDAHDAAADALASREGAW